MGRTLALAIAFNLLIVASASADIPLPKNLKHVDPRVSFDGVDKHANYVFILRYLTFNGNPSGVPHQQVAVKDAKPFNLNVQRRLGDFQLLAMERTEFEKRAKDDPTLKWLNDKTEGVLSANIDTPATTAPVSAKEVPVTTYRVSIKDGKLSAESIGNKRSDASPGGLLPIWAFGIVGAVSLAWFGVWFAGRKGRTGSVAPA